MNIACFVHQQQLTLATPKVTKEALRCATLVGFAALGFAVLVVVDAEVLLMVLLFAVMLLAVLAVLSATCDLLVGTAKKADDEDGCLALLLLLFNNVCVRLVCCWLA